LPPTWGKPGWLLGVLLPGAARHYWLFWPLVLGAFVYLLMGAAVMASTDGLASNLLDAIATPAFNRYFGAGVPVVDPLKQALNGLCTWPWLLGLFIANLVFVFVSERLRPDPAGWFARRGEAGNP
jgi:hypothetical protein